MMSIRVLFLGPAKDFAQVESTSVELAEGATIANLRDVLAARFPRLMPALPSVRFAVNQAFARDDVRLSADDEVALIPPVSGGSGDEHVMVQLVRDPISVERVRSFVMGNPAVGGIVTFEGATRADVDARHGAIVRLDYEAYDGMAERQMVRIADEAKRRWSLGRVALVHRIGSVAPAEVSVMIAVASAHRAEAFEACRWLIDAVKKDVPIWKKDVYEDGSTRWVDPTTTTQRGSSLM